MSTRRPRPAPKHSLLVYHRAALSHGVQLGVFLVVAVVGVFTFSLVGMAFALVLTEALAVLVVPRAALFRASIDHDIERSARAEAVAAKGELTARMIEAHVVELAELEEHFAGIKTSFALAPFESAELGAERVLALERLLVSYVRLAIAFRRSAVTFSIERRIALDRAISSAAAAGRAFADDDAIAERARWASHRRDVLAVRQATWERARAERDTMATALTTIADVVRGVHELVSAASADGVRSEIDGLLGDCLVELAAIRRLEEEVPVDGQVFTAAPSNTRSRGRGEAASEPPPHGSLVAGRVVVVGPWLGCSAESCRDEPLPAIGASAGG